MIPTLFEIGPVPVRSFGLMVALALFVGVVRLSMSFQRKGVDPKLAERYVTAAGLSGLLGARLWYIGENWTTLRHDLSSALFASAGFTFYGGFIIAAIVVYLLARRDGTNIATLCDCLGPSLALGYAVGRLGCQLSGDGDYGSATNSFWGMSYATGIVPTLGGERVYPTPLFESTISLLIVFILSAVEKSERVFTERFQRFGLYLTLISLERVFVEMLRINPAVLWGLSEAQVIGCVFFMCGVLLLAWPRSTRLPAS